MPSSTAAKRRKHASSKGKNAKTSSSSPASVANPQELHDHPLSEFLDEDDLLMVLKQEKEQSRLKRHHKGNQDLEKLRRKVLSSTRKDQSKNRTSSNSLVRLWNQFLSKSIFFQLVYILCAIGFIFIFYVILDELLGHFQKVLTGDNGNNLPTKEGLLNLQDLAQMDSSTKGTVDLDQLNSEVASSETTVRPKVNEVPSATAQDQRRMRKTKRFLRWMKNNGAVTDKIQLKHIPEMGLGVVAKKHLNKGEEYLRIPKRLLISVHSVTSSSDLAPLFGELRKANPPQQLGIKDIFILFLLYERFVRREKSFWHPYIDILPERFDMCPFFWNQRDFEYLKGSNVYQRTLWERNFHQRRYQHFKQKIFDQYPQYFKDADITLEKFAWAEWTYSSRLFFIEGERPREHLVPLAEMVNCFEPFPIDRSFQFVEKATDQSGDVVLRANFDTNKNQQIFESYGYKSNAELMRFEGFQLGDQNPNDCIWIDLPYHQQRAEEIRRKMGLQGPPQYCFSPRDIISQDHWPSQALSYLRLLVSGPDESNRDMSKLVSKDNEYRVYSTLLRTVDDMIRANTYEQKHLENNNLSPQARMAIEFRIFEKMQLKKLRTAILLKQRKYKH